LLSKALCGYIRVRATMRGGLKGFGVVPPTKQGLLLSRAGRSKEAGKVRGTTESEVVSLAEPVGRDRR
jgi:hypothetical protein